ncbi:MULTISPECIES: winged helix-turn-helix transcriptional regulator [unclassified Cellulophaga]|uniref:winged helix-turn-helix transcriptional regulator n=1 Tax=unclassified Cellulophaga TaxID=2634405 RepID=UPI0026E4020B|nr:MULTISPECIES: helix-turn-helix domain-containing protein [unclassified Cellulophaga]MDO6490102.1 helix-turn-helix domain-containing protein [Cellulophaga sp. 2_MG-2023]MDO6494704.1 helix-turn-helix domain-containing protein [Cellulophaga sp. 3_MG-2023]
MEHKFRCNCPITSAIDIIGDKWSLVIIKQMLTEKKKTFKDFIESEEAIATNILSSRLKMLEEFKIIVKGKLPENKKTNIYTLTEKGIALTPLIVELSIWSDANLREFHSDLYAGEELKMLRGNKEKFIENIIENYKKNN